VIPGRNGDPWAFPRAPHPAEQDPATHVGAGTGLDTGPDYILGISRPSLDALTHNVQPHVALLEATMNSPSGNRLPASD
jgi:hypothetical protein